MEFARALIMKPLPIMPDLQFSKHVGKITQPQKSQKMKKTVATNSTEYKGYVA